MVLDLTVPEKTFYVLTIQANVKHVIPLGGVIFEKTWQLQALWAKQEGFCVLFKQTYIHIYSLPGLFLSARPLFEETQWMSTL